MPRTDLPSDNPSASQPTKQKKGKRKHDNDADDSHRKKTKPKLFIFYDLETSGFLNTDPDILQIGAVCGEDTFSMYALPTKQIEQGASAVNNLTYKNGCLRYRNQIVEAVDLKTALRSFVKFCRRHRPFTLVAHNGRFFDSPILKNHLIRHELLVKLEDDEGKIRCLDTHEIARDKLHCFNYKLPTLMSHFLPEFEYESHTALDDSLALKELHDTELIEKYTISQYQFYM